MKGLGDDVRDLITRYDALPYFHEKASEVCARFSADWAKKEEWNSKRRLYFAKAVSRPRLTDRAAGPLRKGHDYEHDRHTCSWAWVSDDLHSCNEPVVRELLPLSRDVVLTLAEKSTVLLAIYEVTRRGTSEALPTNGELERHLGFVAVCRGVQELTRRDKGTLRLFLDEVSEDVEANTGTLTPPKDRTSRRRFVKELNKDIRAFLGKNREHIESLRKAIERASPEKRKAARKAARAKYGRKAMAERFGADRKTVAKCGAWLAIRDTLHLGRSKEAGGKKIGFDIAEECAQTEKDRRKRMDRKNAELEDAAEALLRLSESNLQDAREQLEALSQAMKSGDKTAGEVVEAVNALIGPSGQ